MAQETGIRVYCARDCGPVIVRPAEISLYLCPDEPERNCYTFFCPGRPDQKIECGQVTTRPAGEATVHLLHGLGVDIKYLTIPSEWREHETGKFHERPALTEDDLLDFMAAIDRYNRTGAWSE